MKRTTGPYQERIYAVWDSNRAAWPRTQDGTPMPAMNIPEYHPVRPPSRKIDYTVAMPSIGYFTYERKTLTHEPSRRRVEAIVCTGIVVEPKDLRGLDISG